MQRMENIITLNPKQETQKVLFTLWKEGLFPVDLVTICKRLGLQVVETELPDDVSGL